jgi:CHAT domain-containing protein
MTVLRAFTFLCFLSLLPYVLLSQQASPGALIEQGEFCIQSEDYQIAIDLFEEALPHYQESGDQAMIASLNYWIGYAYSYTGDMENTCYNASNGLFIAEKQLESDAFSHYAGLLMLMGECKSHEGDLKAQMSYYRQAKKAALKRYGMYHDITADAYFSVGAAYGSRGDWANCILYTDSSLHIAKTINYRQGMSDALLNLSYSFAEKEDYQKAVDFQKQALNLATTKKSKAESLHNLGTYYTDLGKLDESLSFLKQAKEIKKEIYSEADRTQFVTDIAIAKVYFEKKDLSKAEAMLGDIIEGLKGVSGGEYLLQIAHNYLARLYLEKKAYGLALQAIHKSINQENGWNYITVSAYMVKGEILMKQQAYEAALSAINQGIQLQVQDYSFQDPFTNPSWDQMGNIDQARILLDFKGTILREMGVEQGDMALLEASRQTLLQEDSLLSWTRTTFHNQRSKDLMAQKANAMSANLLSTLYELYHATEAAQYFDQALACMEKNKAITVLENLNSQYANEYSDVPLELVTREKKLLRAISNYNVLIRRNKGYVAEEQIKEWENSLVASRMSLDSLLTVMEEEFPRYYQMKHDYAIAGVEVITQNILQDNEVLLEYFVEKDQVYILLAGKTEHQFYISDCDQLRENCLKLRDAAIRKSASFFTMSHQLYHCLIGSVAKQIEGKDLLIIPDGILTQIPFELLLKEAVDSTTEHLHKDLPYLIVDHPVRYLLSANTLLQVQKNNKLEQNGRVLALAPEFGQKGDIASERDSLDHLPGAQIEIDSLASSFEGYFLKGKKASEAFFKEHCLNNSIYHLATHTKVDDDLASASYLLLEDGNGEDGRLHAYELYNLDLGADLTVLSSCNTGVGKIKKGEGSISLAHAFAYAGCPNLVMSLWPVRDKTTPALMSVFYRFMNDGMSKAEALRQAKLFCLRDDQLFADPYYWAGFVYVGDATPIQIQQADKASDSKQYQIIGGILTMLTLMLLIIRLRF